MKKHIMYEIHLPENVELEETLMADEDELIMKDEFETSVQMVYGFDTQIKVVKKVVVEN